MKALKIAGDIFRAHDFDFFCEIIVESARAVIVLVGVFFDRHDEADEQRALAWYKQSRKAFLDHGYPPYRATTISTVEALDDNPEGRDFVKKIKLAVDRQNLIAPGRYGTPRHEN